MSTIVLSPGEAITVQFAATEGTITVSYSSAGCMGSFINDNDEEQVLPEGIVIHSDLPDKSGREGVIYHEPYGEGAEARLVPENELIPDPDPDDASLT